VAGRSFPPPWRTMSDILNLIISDLGGHALNFASYHILHSRHAVTVRMTIGERSS
jgi:hypothetical protein